jgi:hypothetical protein
MMVTSRPLADVAVYGLQRRKGDRIGRPWVVRWHVDGRQRSRSFRVRVEAERYRTGLLVAQQAGEPFDPATGEPETWAPQPADTPLHEWARTWLAAVGGVGATNSRQPGGGAGAVRCPWPSVPALLRRLRGCGRT